MNGQKMTADVTDKLVRRRVVYRGRVQGVFFRATAQEISRRFEVVGYVRNLPDGTVELEAQGSPTQVEELLTAVHQEYRANITSADIEDADLRQDEVTFEIVR